MTERGGALGVSVLPFFSPFSFFIQFSKTFVVDFRFEEVQTLKFSVYEVDDKHRIDDTTRHDFIGAMECSLADIVAAGQQYKRTLRASGEPSHYNYLI